MPARPFRILAVALLMALAAIASPAQAQQVAPRITINSVPPGANVFVDGAPQGQAGPAFKVRINKGQHKIRLELEGYKPVEQTVNITTAVPLSFTLERAPARLDIKFPATNDGARGAEIFIDGQPVSGAVPLMIDLPSGRHLVEVKKPGFKIYTETVEVKAGETRPVWVMMSQDVRAGSLLVAADAPNADVMIDGQPRGHRDGAPSTARFTAAEHGIALERRFDTVQTPYGPVQVKVGLRDGRVVNVAPEFEDCRALAEAAKVPLKEVQQRAIAAWYASH